MDSFKRREVTLVAYKCIQYTIYKKITEVDIGKIEITNYLYSRSLHEDY